MGCMVHPFEAAGLGKAPFFVVGYGREVYQACHGAPVQPGGMCDYCGADLMHVYRVRSSDGKVFRTGCDCVLRVDPALYADMREARRAEERALREAGWRAEAEERGRIRGLSLARTAALNEENLAVVYQGADAVLAWAGCSDFERSVITKAIDECKQGSRKGLTDFEWSTLAFAYLACMLPESKHVGTIGKRETFRVRYEGGPIIGIDSQYGPSLLARFRCVDTGAILIWKTSTYLHRENESGRHVSCVGSYDAPIYPGTEIQVTGRVEKHNDYKGQKQTYISRCRCATLP